MRSTIYASSVPDVAYRNARTLCQYEAIRYGSTEDYAHAMRIRSANTKANATAVQKPTPRQYQSQRYKQYLEAFLGALYAAQPLCLRIRLDPLVQVYSAPGRGCRRYASGRRS